MDDNEKTDSFDDLFEPFELGDTPPEGEPDDTPLVDEAPTVVCPSCGSLNPAHNRHCEYCGARISQGPLPVAPQPMLRTTAGARALMVLAAVILIVALIALLINLFGGKDTATSPTGPDATGTSSSLPVQAIEELKVLSVVASSELPGYSASSLIDSDPTNSWNDTQEEAGPATLTFTFAQPVTITQIMLQNVTDEERFHRNYRIRDYEILIDDLPTTTSGTLQDTNQPQTITVPSVATTQLTLRIISSYPAEAWNGKIPFRELALQEVKFFGKATAAVTTSTTTAP